MNDSFIPVLNCDLLSFIITSKDHNFVFLNDIVNDKYRLQYCEHYE